MTVLATINAALLKVARRAEVLGAVVVMAIVFIFIVPLPTWLVDILIALNICISCLLIVLALYLPGPLAFSSFPSILLLTTMFRLALSIATTRLILLEQDAGDIVEAFGNFVVGGNLAVGLVIFMILTLVNFLVITKGSERVAEVAARFSLDAMPGKQMSIDSDLRAGLIDGGQARDKREQLGRESQLFGAMDGAMKFVKGDAIAGLVIVVINLLGGFSTGMFQHGMARFAPVSMRGRIQRVNGMLLQCRLPQARIGDLCQVEKKPGDYMLAEIIGFDQQDAVLSALGNLEGVRVGAAVERLGVPHRVRVSDELLGQVLDGFGRPIAGEGPSAFVEADTPDATTVLCEAPLPTERPRISRALATGVRSIDGLLTLGEGQRVGLFAGAGCGKTTLLAEIARNVECDVIVFGLIGERGRELREFLDHELDDQLRAKAVLVCATSDRSSMERARAAFTATALAEGFRRKGKRVLLLIDSLTRFARAQREIGLAAGEPLGRGGLPPSVYSLLPRLVERAGLTREGVITAIYTVLIEQDSMSDPVADEVRSLLDGHIVLSRKLAERGHYPAVDVLASLSRILSNVAEPGHIQSGTALRRLLSAYQQIELMLKLGEYQPGNDALTDLAVDSRQAVDDFLRQDLREPSPIASTLDHLMELTAYVPF